ncbi:MAG: hypothetical protein M1573_02155 [Candidatus Parvarchaeota archaeon]|nr:hypothetical protein [Candidatus Parvarchaeota archaeon]
MGKVVLKIKVMPKDISTDIKEIAEKAKAFLTSRGSVYKVEIEPLAFGLNVVMITLVIDESEGSSKLESEFQDFKEAEMSIVDVSRMPDF